MPNPIDVGTGTTISFGTSGFSAYILEVGGPGISREVVDTTHMGTTGGKTYRPGDLYDGGELSLSVAFDGSISPPMLAGEQPETITVTWPIPAGLSTGAIWSFSGFMSNYTPTSPIEDKMTASVTVKVTGSITLTAAA